LSAFGLAALAPFGFEIGAKKPPMVLSSPAFALHNFAYAVIMRKVALLSLSERAAFSPYLRGSRFALLADSLLNDTPSPMLAKHGIKLDADQLERAAYLATLPEVIVTPPEDGNRRAERGEKGGKRLRVVEGLLAPPKRVSRVGKQARDKRRAERLEKAMRLKAEREAAVKTAGGGEE